MCSWLQLTSVQFAIILFNPRVKELFQVISVNLYRGNGYLSFTNSSFELILFASLNFDNFLFFFKCFDILFICEYKFIFIQKRLNFKKGLSQVFKAWDLKYGFKTKDRKVLVWVWDLWSEITLWIVWGILGIKTIFICLIANISFNISFNFWLSWLPNTLRLILSDLDNAGCISTVRLWFSLWFCCINIAHYKSEAMVRSLFKVLF